MNRRVAVVYPPSVLWVSRCMDGVRRYAREVGQWNLLSSPPALRGVGGSLTLTEMRGWKGDGIIALIDEKRELREAGKMKIPVVNLGSWLPEDFGIPRVMVNHVQAGRLAADHLLSRGLRDLAFFGWKDAWYSSQRQFGFTQRAVGAGVKCEVFLRSPQEEAGKNWVQRILDPAKWLAGLPRPCGIFAIHDYKAQLLMEACQEAKLRIPQDIALVGMDDDETICEHFVPTLTTISRTSEQVGWEAATLLDRIMQGEAPPREDIVVDPEGVIARQSTDALYCADPLVQRALDYMRVHLKTQFNSGELAERLGISKRTLEMRFRDNLQSSPHEYLTRLRVHHAQALMQAVQQRTIVQIAAECGFGTERTFYAAFERITGLPPASFRRQHGAGKAADSSWGTSTKNHGK